MLAYLVEANTSYNVWGRGAGKTTGLIAPRINKLVQELPGSLSIIGAATYAQLLERTLPPVVAALESWGWVRDVNYVFGKQPPKAWNWPKPKLAPLRWEHTFTFNTGTVFQLISQDRPGSANGLSAVSGIFDECKYLNKRKHDEEIAPIFRGALELYGDHHLYGGLLYCTDMPTMREGMWILEMREQMDAELIELILANVFDIQENQLKLPAASKSYQKVLKREIAVAQRELSLLRRGCVYYSEASAMENLAALGKDYITRMRRMLPPAVFDTSILNKRLRDISSKFYAALSESEHTYQAKDNSYLDSLGFDFQKVEGQYAFKGLGNSKVDADVNRMQPLDIAIDYGGHFNCMAIGQEHGIGNVREFRFLNGMHVYPPSGLVHLVDKFCDYYAQHRARTVYYYYDHTATGLNAASKPFKDVVIEQFRKRGWEVIEMYMGHAPYHEDKHQFWHTALLEQSDDLPSFRWNRDNCDDMLTSMQDAGIKQGRNGFQKDKASEDPKKGISQQHATHYSDAVDQLAWGKYRAAYAGKGHDMFGVVVM